MSRLQKKCFIGATGFHLLLLATLVVGPVFLSPGEPEPAPVLEFIAMNLTEAQVSGGGTPRPPTPTPAPPVPQPQPPPQVQPTDRQPPPEREPDTPKVEKMKEAKPDPDSVEPKPEKKTHQVQISNKVIKVRDLKTPSKSTTDAAAAAAARATAERKQLVASTLKSISSQLTSTTQVEMPDGPNGPGGGGATYASYRDEVRRIYTAAWRIPEDVTDDEATLRVSVTIARDGHVISSRILQPSGSQLVDKSIQATLDRVTFVRPFPDSSKDSQKTFTISFSLKSKKLG